MPRLRTAPLLLAPLLAMLATSAHARAGEKPLREVIDAQVRAVWQREKITPPARCDDATFLRRVFLDLAGTIPTYEEAKSFLADPDPGKRAKLVERLLDDPRYARAQAQVWDQVLFGRNPPNADAVRKRDGFKKWLTEKFAKNESYDRWVRELLLAEQEGSETFLVQYRNQPEEATVAVTRIFLGTQLQCARCHDHPFENWTQRDFYGMAGFFVRLVVVDAPARGKERRFLVGEKSTGEVLFSGSVMEQKPGRKGEPVRPKFLGGPELDEPPPPKGFKEGPFRGNKPPPRPLFSRKEKLAAWVVAPENPYLARAVTNRLWAQFLGRGLVHPIDDLSRKNRPSHPELFKALTDHLVAHKFDLKALIRELVNSETYQAAATGPSTEALPTWFERARVRPLSAEELLASIRQATGFDAGKKPGEARLPGAMEEYLTMFFGSPTDGQGNFQGSLAEHLFLNNAGQLRQMIQARKGNLADAILTSKAPLAERVEQLFLSVLSRPPRPEESKRFVEHLTADARAQPALVEDAIWVLLSCAEFRFNH
jgi:hypothetical protein